MKLKTLLTYSLICPVALLGSTASAIHFAGTCELFYKGDKVAEGECTASQTDAVVSVKAVVKENGAKYQAIVDNDKNSGVIIGCGAFTLADGPLSENEEMRFAFPNGYEMRMKF